MNRSCPPLIVVALGGNAISPPHGDLSLGAEHRTVVTAIADLVPIARAGARLLIVHGNGPQVGRLLSAPGVGDPARLDVHVAQTQGELGYLLAAALDESLGDGATVALVTRVRVDADDPAFATPTKPVGPVLTHRPDGVPAVQMPDRSGWRRVVASPRPLAVIEQAAIAGLLAAHHVIAGGGGGVALARRGSGFSAPPAVVDKDYVAALLAVALDATQLVFVTDVAHAFDRFGARSQQPIARMSIDHARKRLAAGAFAPGSMAPKVESAIQFVAATHRTAVITTVGAVDAARRGEAGTTITA